MGYIAEFHVEEITLDLFGSLGYSILLGPEIAPGETAAEREDYSETLLRGRLHNALVRLNSAIPADALEEALRKVTFPESPSFAANNRAFHRMLVDGVEVEYRRKDGSIAGDRVRLVDFDDPDNNDFLAVNQFTVQEGQHNR